MAKVLGTWRRGDKLPGEVSSSSPHCALCHPFARVPLDGSDGTRVTADLPSAREMPARAVPGPPELSAGRLRFRSQSKHWRKTFAYYLTPGEWNNRPIERPRPAQVLN